MDRSSLHHARPLIGVTTSELREPGRSPEMRESDPPRRELALGLRYLEALERAGALPVALPPVHDGATAGLLARLDGVCLSGGPDLDPAAYGADPHAELGPTEPDLDRFELAVARHAQDQDLPLLAICRGAQALNVARGGTLWQHVPERFGSEIAHRQQTPAEQPTHAVSVREGSLVAGAVGTQLEVNSFHHQAINLVGHRLRPVAWSPDGLIEAVEAIGESFVVGVQWHAECIAARPEQAKLFERFVAAAARRALVQRADLAA